MNNVLIDEEPRTTIDIPRENDNVFLVSTEHSEDDNDKYKYTDWQDMSIDGHSSEVNVKTAQKYMLGCGPALKKYGNYSKVCGN